ncbi:MAG: hypothetical protein AABX11_04360 [Nanoarchaeota archaeon]
MSASSNIGITLHRASKSREDSYIFRVTHTEVTEEGPQHWYQDFSIRDSSGNPTSLGRRMGIRCRDKPITHDSLRWNSIQEYLHKLAWKHARQLSFRYGTNVRDNTPYTNN